MCYSAADGGQRCASHTRTNYQRAQQAYTATPHDDQVLREARRARVQTAAIEYASTPEGQAHFVGERDAAAAAQQWSEEARFNDIIRQGAVLREVNVELREQLKHAPRTIADRIKRRPARLRTRDELDEATRTVQKFGWENAPNGVLID
jgi:hypothetical protein